MEEGEGVTTVSYSSEMAAALSGATSRQLAYWRKATENGKPVLVPEISAERPILYSFRDVVALRTCAYLRNRLSLQKVRFALGTLKDLGETGHLSQYRLVADGRSVVLVRSEDEAIDLVHRPGQQVTVVMADVLRPFAVGQVTVPDLRHPEPAIAVDPEILGGHPVVDGTRVPFELVADLVEDGVPPESISEYYPSVSASAASDAVEFARYVRQYSARRGNAA